MFIGGTGLFGLIHYLVCPIVVLLAYGAKQIAVKVGEEIEIVSDAAIKIEPTEQGLLPFAVLSPVKDIRYEASLLNALSRTLAITNTSAEQREELLFNRGVLVSHNRTEARSGSIGVTLRFTPDSDIFEVTEISPAAFLSYFRRLSFLHAGVRFSLSAGGETHVFQADNGIIDLFTAVSSPYQLMHEPIQFVCQEGSLKLQLVMAYHSWSSQHLLCFINNGRAVEGGTHEQGLNHALKRLPGKLGLDKTFENGVVAILSVQYPDVQWRGCIKASVNNPELKMMVSRLVIEGTLHWFHEHPEVASHLGQLEIFTFPDEW